MSSDVLRQRIITTLSDKLDSDVELGDLSLRVFPGLRADGEDLRIRRRGTPADMPPLISGEVVSRRRQPDAACGASTSTTCSSTASISAFRRSRCACSRKKPKRDRGREPSRPRLRRSRRRKRSVSDPLKDGGVVLDRVDTDDARLIIVPGEPDKAPKIWAIHHLRMHELGSTDVLAVRGDADQRCAAGRNPGRGRVRPVGSQRTGRHAARRHVQFREGRPRRVQGHLRARSRRTARSAARSTSSRPTAKPTRPTSRSRSAATRSRCT